MAFVTMKTSFGSFLQPILLFLLLSVSPSTAVTDHESLVEWLRATPNGFFSDKIKWVPLDPSNPTGSHAMFAAEDISKNETLVVVPKSILVTKGTGYNCDAVKMLIDEKQKGTESQYFPYIDYLFGDDSKKGNLPVAWSELGKELLDMIVGDGLYPQRFSHHNVEDFCPLIVSDQENPTQLETDAYLFMIARSWDDVLIPVYDMVNHRNGKWRNVDATSAHVGKDITSYAIRDISKGEQLYMSYSECDDDDCSGLKYKYVTPFILVDYGFVEQYPRRFTLVDDMNLVAEVDVDEATGDKFINWPLGERPSLEQLNYMFAQSKRLHAIELEISENLERLDSDHERSVIREYLDAYKEVHELAIAYRDGDDSKGSAQSKEYDPLMEAKGVGVEGENIEVCWDNPSHRDWDTSDLSRSQYQEIEFTYNKEVDNTCLHLSGWLQTCTNFRPHYHEAFVHVPAQYVEDVKRVAFLGGGDNMILHEILKYPNLELVVGMELDQQVIRSAFKNLGTLPYFDDHRVHWWFGDATKSLFALPESYFGTFDLVLVDLQTFVADALKVTDKLTIMDTAMLLMKPEGGVIAKNEDFNVRANVGFAKYTVDLEYHDVPQICQQSITMGSNSIDFFTARITDHDVEALTFKSITSVGADPHDAWYSYRQTIRDTCAAPYEKEENSTKSNDQLGILVILEAENLSHSLESVDDVQSSISAAVKDLGLTQVSISSSGDKTIFHVIMQQGYVTARVFAKRKYIAFDVLLWDSLDLVDTLSEALINAVGGDIKNSASSFRFVSGGMSGLDSLQEDVITKVAGETEALLCQDDSVGVAATSDDSSYDSNMSHILSDLVSGFVRKTEDDDSEHPVIAVMCNEQVRKCSSLETLNELKSPVVTVVPIYACDSFEDMQACEQETEELLKAGVKNSKAKLDALVLDFELPFPMGQVLESIFSNKVTHNKIMERTHTVLTPLVDGESWRHVLIDRFRTDIVLFDGAYRADIRFSEVEAGKKGSYYRWSIFSAHGRDYFFTLISAVGFVTGDTGLQFEVEEIANGIVNYNVELEWDEFTDSDYDKTRSKAQWNSQTPMGHQTIFQMNLQPPKIQLNEGEKVLAEHEPGPWDVVYGAAEVIEYLGDEMYEVHYDGETETEAISRDQIRKFSDADMDVSKSFEVGDLIFYQNKRSLYQNGVISRVDEDGTYSIYLLNTAGQKLYGVQRSRLLYQFETADFYQEIPDLSIPTLSGAFEKALDAKVVASEDKTLFESFSIGSGVVISSFWNDGQAVLKWDGMKRVDVNLFTYKEDMDTRLEFQGAFCNEIEYMQSVARDEHPRGYGSVVNFGSEISKPSHWVSAQ
mmetsp:Transcript_14520/g.40367  ORF Transcript_14520/g.40367 Transcript_14520/m.40367 type:complete len:1336 (-) Transcript_14520:1047-5054(-)